MMVPSLRPTLLRQRTISMLYDAAVIGGGAVGCAILNELTCRGFQCILLEKEEHLVSQASAGNGGMCHTGFDAVLHSLEHSMLLEGRKLHTDFLQQNHLPYRDVGAIMVAWNEEELKKLPKILRKAHRNGTEGAEQISVAKLRELEPNLSQDALGAVFIPGESIVDPWLIPITLAHQSLAGGAKIEKECKVEGGRQGHDGTWSLRTTRGEIRARYVVNAAGLYGDIVENIHESSRFSIRPAKGQWMVYDKSARHLLNHIILPIPSDKTKGTILFPTVHGNVIIGPTMEVVLTRENSAIDLNVSKQLTDLACKMLPALKKHTVIGAYTGLRPATEHKDYQIAVKPDRCWVTVGGIRSTGLSTCLSIAKLIGKTLDKQLEPTSKPLPSRKSRITYTPTNRGTVLLDGTEYTVTHPLTKYGMLPALAPKL